MDKDQEIVGVLYGLSKKLADGMNKTSICVVGDDPPPFQGLSEFPFTIIEEMPRRPWILQLVRGSKSLDLVGFTDGRIRRLFQDDRPRLIVLEAKVLTILTQTELREAAAQLAIICEKEVLFFADIA